MCGGSGYYDPYEGKHPDITKGWYMFWDKLSMPKEDVGIFIETTRGCNSVSCKYQCQARTMEQHSISIVELKEICRFLDISLPYHKIEIMYYGMGDVSDYEWLEFLEQRNLRLARPARINISPTINDKVIRKLASEAFGIHFCVNSVEEAILTNMKVRELGCRAAKAIVPVNKNTDWLEIFKILTIDVEFNSLTPSWSSLFVSAAEFTDVMMSIGINVNPEEYRLKSGLKPVIEGCKIKDDTLDITIRRCFQLDSKRITIVVPRDNTKLKNWSRKNKSTYDVLDSFAKTRTSCSKCSNIVWYDKVNR